MYRTVATISWHTEQWWNNELINARIESSFALVTNQIEMIELITSSRGLLNIRPRRLTVQSWCALCASRSPAPQRSDQEAAALIGRKMTLSGKHRYVVVTGSRRRCCGVLRLQYELRASLRIRFIRRQEIGIFLSRNDHYWSTRISIKSKWCFDF